MKKEQTIIVYQTKTGAIELRADVSAETFWATQAQIAKIFNTTPQNITLHLKNVFKENELSQNATCKESLQVQKEGKFINEKNLTIAPRIFIFSLWIARKDIHH